MDAAFTSYHALYNKQAIALDNQELLRLCLLDDQEGQRLLYEQFITPMAQLCLRYIKDEDDVQDVLTEGFIKVFGNIKKFELKGEYSLEAWIRKIMVNECLMNLRKRRSILRIDDLAETTEPVADDHELPASEILKLVQSLPDGYRTIFNLFVIDGYSHKEISLMIGISESASRSQLTHARNKLKELLTIHGWR